MRAKVSETLLPIDYKHGGTKHWWVKEQQTSVFRSYLLCLIRASQLTQDVPHFRTENFYACLLEGRPYEKRTKATFKFDVPGTDTPPAAVRPKPRLRRKGEQVVEAEAASVDEKSESDAASNRSQDSPVPTASSSSGSSSSSSSSKPDEDLPSAVAPAPPAPAASSSSSSSSAVGALLGSGSGGGGSGGGSIPLESTVYWRGAKITQVKQAGNVVAYEVTCYIKKHCEVKRCTRTRSFLSHGGENIAQRLLKSWILQGHAEDTTTAHQSLPDLNEGELPSLQELEERVVDEQPCAMPAKRQRRR